MSPLLTLLRFLHIVAGSLWVGFAAGLNFTIWVLNSGFDFGQVPS